jgi:hypothetical protein
MNEEITPNKIYAELVNNPQVSEYVNLAFQLGSLVNQALPVIDKGLDLAQQLVQEKKERLIIQETADLQRRTIERRMTQLDAELEADLENNKNVVATSMRVFEKMIENGHIDQAMILHERIISKLSGRGSIAADKFNQNNPDGGVKFYTT